jgi:hypothetical protein
LILKKFMIATCPCCNQALAILTEQLSAPKVFPLLGQSHFSQILSHIKPQVKPKSAFADVIYQNAQVITLNDDQPTAEAVAIQDGKILALGKTEDLQALQGENTQIIDLEGKTMLPGFIDGHGHVIAQGISTTVAILLPPPDGEVDSIAKLQDVLRQWSKQEISQVLGIIIGNGYDDSQLIEARHPNRYDLDAVSSQVPVIAVHQSGHLCSCNSKTLELLNITKDTPNPDGGVIQRLPDSQEPNGVMEESASFFVMSSILAKTSNVGSIQADKVVNLIEKGTEMYVKYGFTTLQEGLANPFYLEMLKAAVAQNLLKADIAVYMDYFKAAPNAHQEDWSRDHYYGHLRLAGGKLVLDGSPQGRTAWLTKPYHQPPEGTNSDYAGYPIMTDEQLIERLETAFVNNFQLICHCNGDAAADQLINAIKSLTQKYGPADRRIVMIHAQTLREDQLDQVNELGIIPSFFPSHTFYWGDWHRDVTLGIERAQRISPTKSALERGIKFSIHNDAPIVLPNAMRLLWSAVNRRTRSDQVLGAEQQISPLDGLKALTIWAAYQQFEEDSKGSIEVGKLADFAIVSENPLTIDPMKIKDIVVLETIKEGKTIYCCSKD